MQGSFYLKIFLNIDFLKFSLVLSRWRCLGFLCPKTRLRGDVNNYLNACHFIKFFNVVALVCETASRKQGLKFANDTAVQKSHASSRQSFNHEMSALFRMIWVGQMLLPVCKLLMDLQVFNGEHSSQGKYHFIIRHVLWSTTSLRPRPWHFRLSNRPRPWHLIVSLRLLQWKISNIHSMILRVEMAA